MDVIKSQAETLDNIYNDIALMLETAMGTFAYFHMRGIFGVFPNSSFNLREFFMEIKHTIAKADVEYMRICDYVDSDGQNELSSLSYEFRSLANIQIALLRISYRHRITQSIELVAAVHAQLPQIKKNLFYDCTECDFYGLSVTSKVLHDHSLHNNIVVEKIGDAGTTMAKCIICRQEMAVSSLKEIYLYNSHVFTHRKDYSLTYLMPCMIYFDTSKVPIVNVVLKHELPFTYTRTLDFPDYAPERLTTYAKSLKLRFQCKACEYRTKFMCCIFGHLANCSAALEMNKDNTYTNFLGSVTLHNAL